MQEGAVGLGAASVGISETLVSFALLVIVLFAAWKLAKILWAALSG